MEALKSEHLDARADATAFLQAHAHAMHMQMQMKCKCPFSNDNEHAHATAFPQADLVAHRWLAIPLVLAGVVEVLDQNEQLSSLRLARLSVCVLSLVADCNCGVVPTKLNLNPLTLTLTL